MGNIFDTGNRLTIERSDHVTGNAHGATGDVSGEIDSAIGLKRNFAGKHLGEGDHIAAHSFVEPSFLVITFIDGILFVFESVGGSKDIFGKEGNSESN